MYRDLKHVCLICIPPSVSNFLIAYTECMLSANKYIYRSGTFRKYLVCWYKRNLPDSLIQQYKLTALDDLSSVAFVDEYAAKHSVALVE